MWVLIIFVLFINCLILLFRVIHCLKRFFIMLLNRRAVIRFANFYFVELLLAEMNLFLLRIQWITLQNIRILMLFLLLLLWSLKLLRNIKRISLFRINIQPIWRVFPFLSSLSFLLIHPWRISAIATLILLAVNSLGTAHHWLICIIELPLEFAV